MKHLHLLLLLLPTALPGQLSITGTGTFTIDFDATVAGVNNGAFAGSGFAPTPSSGQLDSDAWAVFGLSDGSCDFGGTCTTGDFARGTSTGGETIGGIYAFETATSDSCSGVQPIGEDFTPGHFTLRIQNNTGATLTQLSVSYEIKVYNDQDRANSFNFSYSLDNSTYTAVAALYYTSPEAKDTTLAWATISRSTTLTSLNLANAAYLYLRWTGADVGGSGSRDEFGLDDIAISDILLPVELVRFEAKESGEDVELNWRTASELNNREFLVEHSRDGRAFEVIGSVLGGGTRQGWADYRFLHTGVVAGVHYYRLRQVD